MERAAHTDLSAHSPPPNVTCWQVGAPWVQVAIRMKETMMSKRRRGNKEAKKPKQVRSVAKPQSPAGVLPTVSGAPPGQHKK